MKKRKKKGRMSRGMGPRRQLVLVALVFAAALVTGLYLPNLFAFSQDLGTDRLDEHVNLGAEALSLTSSESRIERLKLMGTYDAYGDFPYSEPLSISDRSSLFLSEAEVLKKLDELLAMANAAGLDTGSLTLENASAPQPYLVLTNAGSGTSLSTLIVWQETLSRQLQRDDGSFFSYDMMYLVDDATGMILMASYQKSINTGFGLSGSMPDCHAVVQTLAERFRQSEGLAELTTSVEAPAESNPFLTVCYVHFMQERETLYSMPVSIGENRWGINTTAFY